jgi:uncharacterized protein (DUF1501 family)
MDNVTRRRFLTLSGVTAAGALAAGATQVHWSDLLAAAVNDPLPSDESVLVVITLYGGNDGLNTVVPAADPAYQKARPDLAYQPNEVLDLGDGLGLNPGLKGLKGLWDDKQLAIVRGVGYPQPDRSHFRSMAIWQTASPKSPIPTGWLGRWLDATGADPLRAVSVEPTLPPLLAGANTAAASLPLRGLALPKGAIGTAYAALGKPSPGEGLWQAKAARAVLDLQEATRVLGSAVKMGHDETPDEDEQRTQGASAGGTSQLGAQLELIAGLIEAGVPTRAYSASLGGFDTHADERGTQQRLLSELDAALTPFAQRLAKTDRGQNAVVLVYSEFGRRVQANGSDGTDHGTAGPVLVLGNKVAGGFHGEQPSLTDLSNGDLKATTDFRDVYASVLQHVLGTDPGKILDGHTTTIDGLLRA